MGSACTSCSKKTKKSSQNVKLERKFFPKNDEKTLELKKRFEIDFENKENVNNSFFKIYSELELEKVE